MGLDHHRTAGRQGRGRIATGNGEGQREIASPENRHRPQGDAVLADIGARQRLTLRQSAIDTGSQKITPPQNPGKQAQLVAGAQAFAPHAGLRQAALLHDHLQEVITKRLQLFGNGFQQAGPLFRAGQAEFLEGRGGSGHRLLHLLRGGLIKSPGQVSTTGGSA